MRTEERNQAIRQFFTAHPATMPGVSFLLRTSLLLAGFGVFINFFFKNTGYTGYYFILAGAILLVFWFRPYIHQRKLFNKRPSIEEIQNWFLHDLHTHIKERAVSLLRLNQGQLRPENFIIVPYPVFWSTPGLPDDLLIRRETNEGYYMYATWKVQVLALTRNYISFFSCIYNWPDYSIVAESTNEFFYDDISSVKNDVEQEKIKVPGEEEEKNINTFVFKVTNISSDSLKIITRIPELNYSPKFEVNLEKAVQSIRLILRQRRFREDEFYVDNEEKTEADE